MTSCPAWRIRAATTEEFDAARHGHDNAQALAGGLAGRGSVWNAGGLVFNHA